MAVRVVLLKVSNADLLVVIRDWYTKYLDLKVRDQAPGRYVFLTDSTGAQLAFHVGQPAGNPEAVSLYVEVDDVDRLYALLHDEGLQFIMPPGNRAWGGRVVALRDPAGHIVKPFHRIPAPSQDDLYPGDQRPDVPSPVNMSTPVGDA